MMRDNTPDSTLKPKNPESNPPKIQKLIHSAYDLSLGISVVVAVLLGVGLGFLMQKISGSMWLLWLGVFWGVGGAILNIYKAYQRTKKDLETLAKDPKYTYNKQIDEDKDDN